MQYGHIRSEKLLRRLIDIQQALLQRRELPDVMAENASFLLKFSGADYIGVAFIQPNRLYELNCGMGNDFGLLEELKTSQIETMKIFEYLRNLERHVVIVEDGKLCRFFHFEQVDCKRIERLMRERKLLLSPLKMLQHEEWVGVVVMLLPQEIDEANALEVGSLLDMVIAPFYDKETGVFSQACIHESHRFLELSPREREVARLLLRGKHPNEIAQKLTLSINTIKSHIRKIYQTYDISNHTAFINRFLKR